MMVRSELHKKKHLPCIVHICVSALHIFLLCRAFAETFLKHEGDGTCEACSVSVFDTQCCMAASRRNGSEEINHVQSTALSGGILQQRKTKRSNI